ncbi:hypothetical protein BDR07DRAFT_1436463 [Suillus spraguei]|nr:hypothetical protein BDR07DRAFT_1436463 [Suillus spraguei]
MNTNTHSNRTNRAQNRDTHGRGGSQRGPVGQRDPARCTSGQPARSQQAFQGVGIRYKRPIRPGFGTHGEPVTLVAKFFAVKITNSFIYRYRVKVKPTRNARDVQRRLLLLLKQTNDQTWQSVKSFVAFDGRETLVSAKDLLQPMQISVSFFEEGQAPGPNLP